MMIDLPQDHGARVQDSRTLGIGETEIGRSRGIAAIARLIMTIATLATELGDQHRLVTVIGTSTQRG